MDLPRDAKNHIAQLMAPIRTHTVTEDVAWEPNYPTDMMFRSDTEVTLTLTDSGGNEQDSYLLAANFPEGIRKGYKYTFSAAVTLVVA